MQCGLAIGLGGGLIIRRKQVAIYMVGLFISSIPGFVVDLLLPALGDYRYIWIGPVATVIFLCDYVYKALCGIV